MDGRPQPPADAAHTWNGFSTAKWEGDMLTITTTHLKEGYIRRNGIPRSDRATLTEHWIRHGDFLTVVTIVTDPVYLTDKSLVDRVGCQLVNGPTEEPRHDGPNERARQHPLLGLL